MRDYKRPILTLFKFSLFKLSIFKEALKSYPSEISHTVV
jgi:hypothetical protein